MQKLRLNASAMSDVVVTGESGLDYYTVNGKCDVLSVEQPFFVRTDGTVLPFNGGGDFYDLLMLAKAEPFPEKVREITLSQVTPCRVITAFIVSLPTGYVPSRGAHSLLGKITLKYATRFLRFTSTPHDPRYVSGELTAGTYLSTQNDATFVNTGFGAVGRFALPMPIPASYRHDYTLPASTVLAVGTVSPAFGQAGGGVEVCTNGPVVATLNKSDTIDDY